MKHIAHNHYVVMFFIMILSGLLSTMNVWVDKYDDMRISLNDLYMILLMCGWMIFFMGLWYRELYPIIIGLCMAVVNIWCIRTQFLITESQYKTGMIPHHSMAILMSKKLLEKENNMSDFLENLINTQEKEITFMKSA
jgi:hypothetical protein